MYLTLSSLSSSLPPLPTPFLHFSLLPSSHLLYEHSNYDLFVLATTWLKQVQNLNKFIQVFKNSQLVACLLCVLQTKACKRHNSKCRLPFFFSMFSLAYVFRYDFPFSHMWFSKWRIIFFCKPVLVPSLIFLCHLRIIYLFTTTVYKISLETFRRENRATGKNERNVLVTEL